MNKYSPLLGFVDLLLNLAVTFCFLFILSQIINTTKQKEAASPREGKFMIEATWNPGVDADVDLWVKGPNNERSGFFSRDVGGLSLLRDDLGNTNDRYTDDKGQIQINPINREEVTVRTPMPGKYTVNLHYFRSPANYNDVITVVVILKRIKEGTSITERKLELRSRGEEMTAFTFTLDNQGNVSETEQPDKPILWVVNGATSGIEVP